MFPAFLPESLIGEVPRPEKGRRGEGCCGGWGSCHKREATGVILNVQTRRFASAPAITVTTNEARTPPISRRGEAAWFEAAFAEHWGRVYALLYRLVGERAEAEDLALEVFLRLHERPPARRENLAGWLHRVALNLGFNALRARSRRRRYEAEAGRQALSEGAAGDPAAEAERDEQRRLVRAVLARMNPRSARLLVLRHSGLSYAEVAQALGLAAGSIGALLARAEREFEDRFRQLEGG